MPLDRSKLSPASDKRDWPKIKRNRLGKFASNRPYSIRCSLAGGTAVLVPPASFDLSHRAVRVITPARVTSPECRHTSPSFPLRGYRHVFLFKVNAKLVRMGAVEDVLCLLDLVRRPVRD